MRILGVQGLYPLNLASKNRKVYILVRLYIYKVLNILFIKVFWRQKNESRKNY